MSDVLKEPARGDREGGPAGSVSFMEKKGPPGCSPFPGPEHKTRNVKEKSTSLLSIIVAPHSRGKPRRQRRKKRQNAGSADRNTRNAAPKLFVLLQSGPVSRIRWPKIFQFGIWRVEGELVCVQGPFQRKNMLESLVQGLDAKVLQERECVYTSREADSR